MPSRVRLVLQCKDGSAYFGKRAVDFVAAVATANPAMHAHLLTKEGQSLPLWKRLRKILVICNFQGKLSISRERRGVSGRESLAMPTARAMGIPLPPSKNAQPRQQKIPANNRWGAENRNWVLNRDALELTIDQQVALRNAIALNQERFGDARGRLIGHISDYITILRYAPGHSSRRASSGGITLDGMAARAVAPAAYPAIVIWR
jgi:hypothetical protein